MSKILESGQIWRDERKVDRFIRIDVVTPTFAGVRTVVRVDGRWRETPHGRSSLIKLDTFGAGKFVCVDK